MNGCCGGCGCGTSRPALFDSYDERGILHNTVKRESEKARKESGLNYSGEGGREKI